MLFISYICYGGSYPHPKGCELATAYLSKEDYNMANIIVTRSNYARYGEAALAASIEWFEKHPNEAEDVKREVTPSEMKQRRDFIWNRTVELFNDPKFQPEIAPEEV